MNKRIVVRGVVDARSSDQETLEDVTQAILAARMGSDQPTSDNTATLALRRCEWLIEGRSDEQPKVHRHKTLLVQYDNQRAATRNEYLEDIYAGSTTAKSRKRHLQPAIVTAVPGCGEYRVAWPTST